MSEISNKQYLDLNLQLDFGWLVLIINNKYGEKNKWCIHAFLIKSCQAFLKMTQTLSDNLLPKLELNYLNLLSFFLLLITFHL